MNYSVLMSVYFREKPEYLRQSIESILAQTIKTDDLVLVCDGSLNVELDAVIEEFQVKVPIIHVIRLEKNGGLGHALNIGIKFCKNELIARMDTDDIAYPERCEKQLAVFLSEDVDIVSASIEEFSSSPDIIDARRGLPEFHDDILAFAKKRNPFNHPCVMFRKSAVEKAGGYQEIFLLEDYFLWVRMLINGNKGYNIQEPLLRMRAGSDMYKRRGGLKYTKAQLQLFKYMREQRFIGSMNYYLSCMIRMASSCAPNWLRKYIFNIMLRQ